MSDDLRTLAQAVVDDPDSVEARTALGRWIGFHRDDCPAASLAVDILAALDAERAQGYARAMGEVVERCEDEADDAGYDALGDIADWARERLPAAADSD